MAKTDNGMFQRLQLEVIAKDKRKKTVTFKVTGQSNRGEKFGNEVYDDGIGQWCGNYTYRSSEQPNWDSYDCILYVQGADVDKDHTAILVKAVQWEKIKKDVTAFNKQFRGSPMCIVDNFVEAEATA
jgi:hypothetical protein